MAPYEFAWTSSDGKYVVRAGLVEADLLDAARDTAERLLKDFPDAADRHVERWLGGRRELLKV